MADTVISAKYDVLRGKAAQLRALADKVSARPCSITLSGCKGAYADSFNQTTAAVDEVAKALVALCNASATQIERMCQQFNEADELAATQYSGGK